MPYSKPMTVTRRRTSNLPAESTSFIGRPRELSEGVRLLADARLLTLTGPGGVGKTRLALRIAADRRRAFPDGVWLIDLASLRDGGLLARTIAATLGLREESTQPSIIILTEYLRDKQLLLVLDNCEHLLDDCAILASKLLATTLNMRILATSRHTLNIKSEFTFPVPPMSTPDPDQLLPMEQASQYEAVKLFADRAAASMPDFAITEENYVMVARLCHLLDGIPLAIELAAIWLRALSIEQVVDNLKDRYRLLIRGDRTEVPRHQTLRAAMDWSYELCSSAEQTLWERLSVFSGGFSLEAAEAVCPDGDIARDETIYLVASLVDKSILSTESHGVLARYRMLETIRQYGHARLVKSGHLEMLRKLHRDYYLNASRRADVEFFSPLQAHWLDWLRAEFPNLRVALDYCVSNSDKMQAGLEIAAGLHEYWLFEGILGEGRLWLDRALERARERNVLRVKAQAVDATVALWQGDLAAAEPLTKECSSDARKLADRYALARTMHLQGAAALFEGNPKRAISLLEQVIDRYGEDYGDPGDAFLLALYMAMAACQADDRAVASSMKCKAMAEQAKAEWSLGWGLWVVGFAYWRQGEMSNATAMLQESLRLQRSLKDRWGPTWTVEVLAWTAAATGQHKRATKLLGNAHRLRELIDVSIPGLLADAHELYAEQLSRSLGEEVYATLFRQGADTTSDQALAHALGKETGTTPEAGIAPSATPACPLSRREQEVAELVAKGMSNKEIAATLVIAQRTAESHVENILTKLGFSSRTQIAAWAIERARGR
jgi:predicted ATPase/DNA-binding CsgD family transcriptional regulator